MYHLLSCAEYTCTMYRWPYLRYLSTPLNFQAAYAMIFLDVCLEFLIQSFVYDKILRYDANSGDYFSSHWEFYLVFMHAWSLSCIHVCTQNRRNSFPARKIKPSRSSLPPFESPTSLTSPRSLSPITTPTHSHTPTSHSRQLSEIEEEEEKNRSAQKDHEPPSVKNDTKKTDSKPGQVERERGGKSCSKPEAKSARVHRDNRRQSADAEGVLRKTRSRDSLVQMDRGSRSRPESPTLTPQRDISKYSPLTERRRIVNKLKRFASEDSSSAGDSGVEKPQPPPSSLSPSVSTSVSSQMRETDIETSLDYNVEGVMQEGVPRIEEPLHINSPLIAIQQAMENEKWVCTCTYCPPVNVSTIVTLMVEIQTVISYSPTHGVENMYFVLAIVLNQIVVKARKT